MDLLNQLDNPVWHALTGAQAPLAQLRGGLACYPREVAPFCAVEHGGVRVASDALERGEMRYLVGAIPRVPAGWTIEPRGPVLQMLYEGPPPAPPAGIDLLGPDDLPDMLALTDLVYPEYFRPATPRLGQYVGIHQHGQLAAMAGERFGLERFQEISAVCTHPSHTGRGHARTLLAWLLHHIMAKGQQPFLHVGGANLRARAVYEQLGFVVRCEVPHARVRAA